MKVIFFIFCAILCIVLQANESLTTYESVVVAWFIYEVLAFLDNLGKRMVILDFIVLITIFSCLLMPVLGYHYFTMQNKLAYMWFKWMVIPSDEYFSFMLPASAAMTLGLRIPIFFRKSTQKDHTIYLERAKLYVAKMKWQGIILIVIGFCSSILGRFTPAILGQIFFLAGYLIFVGIFYCLYSDFPNKRALLIGAFVLLFLRALYEGLFGEFIYMAIMTLMLVILGKRIRFVTKMSLFVVGIVLILVIQLVKPAYRKQVWSKESTDNKVALFSSIMGEKLSNPSKLAQDEQVWFAMYARFNQGHVIALVMRRVPARYPYANGETIYLSLAGAVVPRFMWPDKPESGGAYNFKRFLGVKLTGYSVGISPFGEAWGNFSGEGGIVFMFFFGLLFNFFFHWLLKIAIKVPSLLLWFPLFFFYAVKIETEVFTMLNSFTKAGIFAYFVYRYFPVIFKRKI